MGELPQNPCGAGLMAKPVAKVSPLRGLSVERWIELKTQDWQGALVRRVVAVIKHAAPAATCAIKWGHPVFEQSGPFAYVRSAKQHLTIGFWRGATLPDPKRMLECSGQMGHFKLCVDDKL